MLPKGVLGREYYRRLYIYSDNKINYLDKTSKTLDEVTAGTADRWIKVEI